MSLHLIKLCVGADSVEDLRQWQTERLAELKRQQRPAELVHTTRQFPRRKDDIIPGGSLYWVIRGIILVRQPLIDLRPVTGDDGIERCEIVYRKNLIPVRPWPRRAFQGWRYLPADDAPPDLKAGETALDKIDPAMRRQLLELGLL
mgnify:CR=1 FL=1